MKIVTLNPNKLTMNDIDREQHRVKVLLFNSKDEVLLCKINGVYNFIGGHIEENETILETQTLKKKDFRLEYVPYKELKDTLEENRENAKAEKREFIIDEMLAVLKVCEKEVDRNNRQEETM